MNITAQMSAGQQISPEVLLDAGVARTEDIERAKATSQGFGRIVRSREGLDRRAVRKAFSVQENFDVIGSLSA